MCWLSTVYAFIRNNSLYRISSLINMSFLKFIQIYACLQNELRNIDVWLCLLLFVAALHANGILSTYVYIMLMNEQSIGRKKRISDKYTR